MTAPDATVWEDIKHAYIHGREPVVVIAARFGYSLSAIERRRRSESWPMRSARPDYKAFAAPSCQSARNLDPRSACKVDPFFFGFFRR